MFRVSEDEIEFQRLVNKQGKEINDKFKRNFSTQEATLKQFLKTINYCAVNNLIQDNVIWNTAGYVNLISLDLKHLGRDLFFADDEWGTRLYARSICMIIYEAIDDLLELLGKNFRSILQKFSKANELIKELNNLAKRLNEYKEHHKEILQQIRNVATAHRDKNIMEQINVIKTINRLEVMGFLHKFDEILNDLGKFMQKIIDISLIEIDRKKSEQI